MNYQTYQQIRAYCYQDLQGYIDTPERNAVLEMNIKLAGGREGIARIKHEQDAAHDLFRCLDLTPRENAAARLLAVISNHRAITWQREPRPPSGKEPAPPLEKSMADALAKQTSDAVKKYAAFLPEPERAVLIADCEAALTAAPAKGATLPDTSPSGDDKPWLIAAPNDPAPDYSWYTPARYFARQLVKDNSALLVKKEKLAEKTAASLAAVGVFKRGKKKLSLSAGTVLKSFVNVTLS